MMRLDLPCEVSPDTSLVEIVGNHRVLIENQIGIQNYSRSHITVNVRQGLVCISGENLELQQMTKNQLVITGDVFGISFADWG